MVSRLLKTIFIYFMYYTGIINLHSFFRRVFFKKHDITILGYHRVLDFYKSGYHYSQEGIVISKEAFQKQIEYLAKNYTVISFKDLLALKSNKNIPKNLCIITFDDGWKDNFTNAFPILSSLRVPATIFLTASYIDGSDVFWHTKLIYILDTGEWNRVNIKDLNSEVYSESLKNELKRLKNLPKPLRPDSFDPISDILKRMADNDREKVLISLSEIFDVSLTKLKNEDFFLSWNDVKVMSRAKISFGSHSHSHRIFTDIAPQDRVDEILLAEKKLKKHSILDEIRLFSYPNGNWNVEIRNLLKKHGYHFAVTCDYGLASMNGDALSLKRINIHEGCIRDVFDTPSLAFFAFELSGIRSLVKVNLAVSKAYKNHGNS